MHRITWISLMLFCLLLISCSESNDSDSNVTIVEPVIPSSLSFNVAILGKQEDTPFGDGSGKINVSVSATNAVKYLIRFGDGNEIESISGTEEYTYTKVGKNKYFIQIVALSSTDDYITDFVETEVLVSLTPDNGNDNLTLIWSDEFDEDGAPNPSNWTYDIGRGNNGWGNGEAQYYTKRADNVIVSNGTLKIIAKREDYSGANYTSARLLTSGLFDFTYGKVEIRAKLPSGGGTWPAL